MQRPQSRIRRLRTHKAVLLLSLCVLALLFLAVCGCGIEGLHTANPMTRIRTGMGGFEFSNSKDVSVELEEGEFDPDTRRLKLTGLDIKDNASKVREANAEQMEGLARQAQANWDGAINFVEKMPDLIGKFTPWVRPEYAPPMSMPSWMGGLLLLLIGVPLALLLVLTVFAVAYRAARRAWAWSSREVA